MLKRALALSLMLGAVLTPLDASASAAQVKLSGYTVHNGTLWDDCTDYDYEFAITLPPGTDSWVLNTDISEPDGDGTSDYNTGDGTYASGTNSIFLCGLHKDLGRYDVSGEITAYDADYNSTLIPVDQVSFSLTAPSTKTALTASTYKAKVNSAVTFKIKSREETARGYVERDYEYVKLQSKVGGVWKPVKDASKVFTNGAGVWKQAYRMNVPAGTELVLRAITLKDDLFLESKSKVIRVQIVR